MRMTRRRLWTLNTVLAMVSAYLLTLAYLYFMQTSIIFKPGGPDPFAMDHTPFQAFVYQTPMGLKERGLWFPPDKDHPVIVYFHGNAGNIGTRLGRARKYLGKGYGVALVEYRGYGGNPGVPSEKNLYEDARAAIDAIRDKGVPLRQMVLYGESLGSGVAVQMATEKPQVKALVLEAPYTSIVDVAAQRYWFLPIRSFVKEKFDSAKKIGAVKMPVLIMHGTNDGVIPYEMGQALFKKVTSPDKVFVSIKGARHNNLYDHNVDGIVHEFLQNIQ